MIIVPVTLQAQVFDKFDYIMFVNKITRDTIVAKKENVLIMRTYQNQIILRIAGYDYDIKLVPSQYGFSNTKTLREAIENKLYPAYTKYFLKNNVDDTIRNIRYYSDTLLIRSDTLIYRSNQLYKVQKIYP